MKNLVLRTVTGVAFVAVMVAGILYSPISLWALFLVITVLTTWEFTGLVNAHAGVQVNRIVTTATAAFFFLGISALQNEAAESRVLIVPWLLSIIFIMVEELFLKRENPLGNWAYSMFAQLYVALPFAVVTLISDQTYVMAIFLFLWCNDTGAYCTGSLIGRHKLIPRISPGKTWEGCIGGALLAMACAALMFFYIDRTLSLPQWLGFALIVVVAGTLGDLVESLFKRRIGVKDSGNILPGHGGMLDRFDSSLMAIPAIVAYLFIVALF